MWRLKCGVMPLMVSQAKKNNSDNNNNYYYWFLVISSYPTLTSKIVLVTIINIIYTNSIIICN